MTPCRPVSHLSVRINTVTHDVVNDKTFRRYCVTRSHAELPVFRCTCPTWTTRGINTGEFCEHIWAVIDHTLDEMRACGVIA